MGLERHEPVGQARESKYLLMSSSSDNSLLANQLPISVDFPEEQKELRESITETYKKTASAVNTKVNGFYLPEETGSFKQYFTPNDSQVNRNVYRKTIDFGALPNAGVTSVAHGITFDTSSTLTQLYAAATDPVNLLYIPIPYASPTLANNIEISLDATNVIITTGSNRSAFTTCYVVIEWLKN